MFIISLAWILHTLYTISLSLSLSTNKDNEMVQTIMDQSNIDIWQVGSDGTVDMRMDRRTSKVVQRYLPDLCTVIVDNVETHVREAEENMLTERQKLQMMLQQYSYGKVSIVVHTLFSSRWMFY